MCSILILTTSSDHHVSPVDGHCFFMPENTYDMEDETMKKVWKKAMKQGICLALSSVMMLSLTACGSTDDNSASSASSTAGEQAAASVTESGEQAAASAAESGEQADVSASGTGDSTMQESAAPGGGMQGGAGGMTDYKQDDTVLQTMISDTVSKFQQFTYTDAETGLTIDYNLYVPADYNASESYPLVYFIADSSVVGQDTTAPLTQGYGGIIWATDAEQAKHESFVLVPEYPDVVLDDHDGYTTSDYLEATVRLLESVESSYNVDQNRIYATGQSMGCMIFMYLAAEHPDLFAAELFVDGQWDITQLSGLENQKFFYFAAEGDEKASAGQSEVMDLLKSSGISYSTAEWDATWSTDEFDTAVKQMLSEGNTINCVQWKLGTVLPDGVSAGTSEHMYSFDHAYTTEAVRDWLFEQSK
jgi:predicted peptidase